MTIATDGMDTREICREIQDSVKEWEKQSC